MIDSRWRRIAACFAAWTLIGLFLEGQALVGSAYAHAAPLTWMQALTVTLGTWYARGALSPIAGMVTRRLPIVRAELGRRLLIHLGTGLAWSAVATLLVQAVSTAVLGGRLLVLSPVEFATSLLTYAVLVGVTQVARNHHRSREQEITASRLEARLATARLDLLRMHLNPHFLLNTLRDVSTLMREDVDRAAQMIDNLSELLHLSVRYVGDAEVPLSEEVGFLRRYLELEQMRFQDRLEARVDVEPDALSARVPYLLLQPLVENAVHGVAPRVDGGRVEVRGRADGEALVLEVYGDGPAEHSGEREEIDLRVTCERLRDSYGASYRFAHTALPGGGLCVRLELPLRRSAPM